MKLEDFACYAEDKVGSYGKDPVTCPVPSFKCDRCGALMCISHVAEKLKDMHFCRQCSEHVTVNLNKPPVIRGASASTNSRCGCHRGGSAPSVSTYHQKCDSRRGLGGVATAYSGGFPQVSILKTTLLGVIPITAVCLVFFAASCLSYHRGVCQVIDEFLLVASFLAFSYGVGLAIRSSAKKTIERYFK